MGFQMFSAHQGYFI